MQLESTFLSCALLSKVMKSLRGQDSSIGQARRIISWLGCTLRHFRIVKSNSSREISKLSMEKTKFGKLVVCAIVVFLGTVAFSCSLAAEFKKAKAKDIKLDGSLCSLPRSSAFGLGITALVCLSVAQIAGTSAAGTRLFSGEKKARRSRIVPITLLVSSWITFGLAMILLATGSSMNGGQRYGKGWMDGDCYIVRSGVFFGAAMLVVTTVVFVLGFTWTTEATIRLHAGPDEEGRARQRRKEPKKLHIDDSDRPVRGLIGGNSPLDAKEGGPQ